MLYSILFRYCMARGVCMAQPEVAWLHWLGMSCRKINSSFFLLCRSSAPILAHWINGSAARPVEQGVEQRSWFQKRKEGVQWKGSAW